MNKLSLQDLYGGADAAKTMYGYSSTNQTSKRTLETEDIAGCISLQPDQHSLSLFNTFEFDGTTGGQITVSNVSQGTNTVGYSAPQNRTVNYGTTFEFGALAQQTVNGHDYRFLRWTDNATGLNRTHTITSALSLSSYYKGHLLSNVGTMSGANGQRKLTRDANGAYHLAYSSNGYVWYASSTDNGATWSTEQQLRPYFPYAQTFPTIATHLNYVFVVWQEYEGVVNGMHQYRIRGVWKSSEIPWHEITMQGYTQEMIARFTSPTDPLPTLVAADNTSNEINPWNPARPELMCVWRNGDGLSSAIGYRNNIAEGDAEEEPLSEVYLWNPYVRFGHISGTTATSKTPSLGTNHASRVGLVYEQENQIYSVPNGIYSMTNEGDGWSDANLISSESQFDSHRDVSTAFDATGRQHVAWTAHDNWYEWPTVILHRSIEPDGYLSPLYEIYDDFAGCDPLLQSSVSAHSDGDGGVSLFWTDNSGCTGYTVFDNYSYDGVNFEGWKYSSFNDPVYTPASASEVEPTDAAYVVRQFDTAPYYLYFDKKDDTGPWLATHGKGEPQAISAVGRRVLIENRSDNARVAYNVRALALLEDGDSTGTPMRFSS
ncbi:MAG: hypothetical protein HY961_15465 [Ignavibacteriae bacterium]|nr:hypothetical protein [Ignavibacteriota bacterium]